jgi:hypothetical protein
MGGALWGISAAAGKWQEIQMHRLVNGIARAGKVPVPHETGQWDGRVLFSPKVSDQCAECQNAGLLVDFRTSVYAVRIAAGPDEPDLRICYEVEDAYRDFSKTVKIALAPGAPCDLLYCFPVFEPTVCAYWSRFAGVSLPEAQAGRFKGFFRVERPEELDLLVSVAFPDNPERFLDRQRLVLPWPDSPQPMVAYDVEGGETFNVMRRAAGEAVAGKWQEALATWDSVAASRPRSLCAALGRAEALERLERPAEAMDTLSALLAALPGEGRACGEVDEYLRRTRDGAGRVAAWQELVARLPGDACVRRSLEKSLSSEATAPR